MVPELFWLSLYCEQFISRMVHNENMPTQYTEIFSAVKIKISSAKNLIFLNIFAQNKDCGYRVWTKNKKILGYPSIPQFFYIKVGFKGVYNLRTCFPGSW